MSKKVTKAKMLSRAKKMADRLWSVYIRLRDGKCLICGSTEKLQAHHCIVRKALSNLTRWNIFNGITLCYKCHLIEIHNYATKSIVELYIKKLNELYTSEQQENVYKKSKEGTKLKLQDILDIISNLKIEISELKKLKV